MNRQVWPACLAGAFALTAAPIAARAAERADDADPVQVNPNADRQRADQPRALPLPDFGKPDGEGQRREERRRRRHSRDIYKRDYFIVGIGAAVLPAYEGSRRNHVIPAFGFGGRIKGIGISARTAGAAFNVLPPRNSRVGFGFGPVIRWRGARSVDIADPAPIKIGRGKGNLELGLNASVSLKHVLSNYDSLSLGTDVRFDASRGTGSMTIAPGLNYFTPVSHSQVVGISASADIINLAQARQSYTVTPAPGTTMPGIVPPHGGLRAVGGRIFTAYDLDHDLKNGGFAVILAVGYTRLVNTAGRSPLVTNRGSHDQVVLATGLGFAF